MFSLRIIQFQKCFLAVLMIKVTQIFLITWGQLNLYFFSYYKHYDADLNINWLTMGFLIFTPIFALVQLFSMRIAEKVGYRRIIIFGQISQTIGISLSSYMPKFQLFLVCYIFLPSLNMATSTFPTLACLWSHFHQKQGKVTGIAMGIFGLSGLIFTILMTSLINPQNKEATLDINEGKSSFKYFDFEVAQNVPSAIKKVAFILSLVGLTGSYLISYKQENQQKPQIFEMVPEQESKSEQTSIKLEETKLSINEEITVLQSNNLFSDEIKKSIFSKDFKVLYFTHFTVMFTMIFFGANFKKYAISKINDDYFITLALTISQLISSLFNMLLGYILDFVNFKKIAKVICLLASLFVFLLPVSTIDKRVFCITLTLLTVFDRGFLLICGPGLNRIYDSKLGPQLLPLLSSTLVISLILTPLYQWVLQSFFDYDGLIQITAIFVFIGALNLNQLKKETPALRQFARSKF